MEFSARIKKEAKHYNVRPDWLVMADLRSLGYTDAEAYAIVHQESAAMSAQNEITLRERIVSKQDFKNLVADRKKLLATSKASAASKEDIDLITNEQVAKEILAGAMMQPEGSKERADMFMKYADLTRKNADIDTSRDTDDGINIYLPVKCYECVLLEAYLERQGKLEKTEGEDKEETTD